MATVIHPDGREETVEPKNGTNFSLEELQGVVGGYIEILPLDSEDKTIMVLNEEGKLTGLELNPKATFLTRDIGLMPGDVIVGPVLVCLSEQVQ